MGASMCICICVEEENSKEQLSIVLWQLLDCRINTIPILPGILCFLLDLDDLGFPMAIAL